MKHAANQTLYAYWNRLRAGRKAPERADIDPASIRGVLADTFIVEVEPLGLERPPGLKVRLGGTRFNAMFDRDMKGSSLWSWWRPADLPVFEKLIAAVLDEASPAVIGAVGSPPGFPPLAVEFLLLPLRHRGKTHARILGGMSPIAVPNWLGLLPIGTLELVSYRLVEEAAPLLPRQAGARVRPSFAAHRATPKRRGHLTILEGGLALSPEERTVGLSPN